jgi:hypothetical protein
MPDVENSHPIIENPIKDLVGVAHQRQHMNARAFADALGDLRVFPYLRDDGPDSRLDRGGDGIPEGHAVGRKFMKIGNGAVGIFDLHARRKARKAASTCCWLATPLRSAASMACN